MNLQWCPQLQNIAPENYEFGHFLTLVECAINWLFAFLVPVCIILIIWGAYHYLTAYGNEEKAQKGKTIIFWAIVGLIVGLLARMIIGNIRNWVGV